MLYRTVFGAVWVYFGKEPSTIEVINDIDKELINLFKMIKYHSGIWRFVSIDIMYKKLSIQSIGNSDAMSTR